MIKVDHQQIGNAQMRAEVVRERIDLLDGDPKFVSGFKRGVEMEIQIVVPMDVARRIFDAIEADFLTIEFAEKGLKCTP